MTSFPAPSGNIKVFSPCSLSENLVGLLELKLIKVLRPALWPGPLGLLNNQNYSHWAFRNSSVMVLVFLPWPWFPLRLLWESFCSSKLWSLYLSTSLFNLGNSGLFCDLTLTDLQRIFDFFFWFCSSFYLLSRWNGDFQTLYMLDWKPEVSWYHFNDEKKWQSNKELLNKKWNSLWGNQNWKSHMYPNVHCNTIYNS